MDDIFISYSRKDKAFATRLHEALQARQREAWVDLEDIPPTAEWREKIKAGIEGARAFVFVMSPDSMASPECLKEVDYAAATHKRLIPVVCREVETQAAPEALAKLNWIFLREQDDFEKGIDALLTAVDTDLEWVDAHTRLLEKATEWERKGRDKSLLLRGGELRKTEDWQAQSGAKEPKPTELQGQFILTSRQGETSRQRKLLSGVSLALVVTVALAVVAYFQYRQADRRGRIALSRQLAAQSSNLVGKERLDSALLLSLEAGQIWQTLEAKSSLLAALLHEPFPLTFLHGHTGAVKTLDFSPDGRIMASGGSDKIITLWDVASRQPLGSPLTGHADAVSCVAFSPDSKILATASYDNTILLWDLASRKPLGPPLKGHNGKIFSLTFSRDSRFLASGAEKTIILWDVNTRLPLGQRLKGHEGFVRGLAFSPDGKLLASGDGKNIIFWDIETAQPQGPSLDGPGLVNSLAFSSDGKTLASAHMGNEVILWDVEGRKVRTRTKPSSYTVRTSAAFNSSLNMLASGSNDRTVTLWDVEKQRPWVAFLTSHSYPVDAVAFSPNGKTLASGSRDGSIILWDLSGKQLFGKTILSSQMISNQDGKITFLLGSGTISPDEKILAQVNIEKLILHFDPTANPSLKPPLPGAFGPSSHEELSEMVARLNVKNVTIEKEPAIRLRDLATGHLLGSPLPGLSGAKELSKVVFSPDGKFLATAKDFTTILVWEAATQKLLQSPLAGNGTKVWSLAFSPDGKLLASGQNDNQIMLWEIPSLKPIGAPFIGHTDSIHSIAFSRDGKTLASGGGKGTIIFWDVATRRAIGPPLQNHALGVVSLAFSPDGRILASGSLDQTIILWDVATRRTLGPPLTSHNRQVSAVRFSPDGKTLASAGADGSVVLWDVATRLPIGPSFKGGSEIEYLSFSSSGKTLTSTCMSQTIQWDVDPAVWKSQACRMANRSLSQEEWRRYLGDEPYRKTCSDLPGPEDGKEAKSK